MNGTEGRRMAPCSRRRVVGMGMGLAGVAGVSPALLGAGCAPGGGAGSDAPPPALTKEPVTLRLQQLAGQSESYAHKFSAEFSQQHPNVKTEIEEYPSADYWTKMLALHASDQLGDLAYGWNSQGHLASWAHKGLARALDDLVRADKFDLAQFYPGAIEADRWEGKLWALPTVGHLGEVTLFYNMNHFDAAGVKYPDTNWKLDDVVDAARRLTKADVWGYGWGRNYWQVVIRTRAFGGDFLSPDGKQAVLNTPAAKAALQWEYDMIGRLRVAPSPADAANAGQTFMDGNLAMYNSNVATVTTWRRPIGERFRWAATLYPPGPSGKRGTALHTNTMHVLRPTKHPREAWELLKHLTSHEVGVQKILMESGSPGGRPDVWNDQRLWNYEPWYKVGASLMPEARPSHVAYNLRTSEVISTMEGGLADIWNAKVAPATGADQINQAMQAILDQPR
ncbi:MAG TPA: extracellular solute-binding protein [Chloroflexota bacterium]|nr:extracellular solute-binding protein [Chloroflexota bacterium]